MEKFTGSKYVSLLLIFVLCLSFLPPTAVKASNEIEEAIPLEKGEPLEGEFSEYGQIQWYKLEPSQEEINAETHMRIKLTGDFEGNVSVYPDKERATKDETFEAYRGYITPDVPVQIDMPHAWDSPVYVKVEFFGSGSEEFIDEEAITDDSESEPQEPILHNYQIEYDGVTLRPADTIIGEECPVEMSTAHKASGVEILKNLRIIRDTLLSKTDDGKELSSLYYKTAPFLVTTMIKEKDVRETVYQKLVLLNPLFKHIAENGDNSTYRLTAKDQAAINELYKIVLKYVPEQLKQEVEKIAKELGITNLTGKTVSQILANSDMTLSQTDTNRVIIKLKDGENLSKTAKLAMKSVSMKALKANDNELENTFVIDGGKNSQTLATQLNKLPEIEYAEPVYKYTKQSLDTQYPYQWSLKNTGQDLGKADADIHYTGLEPLLTQEKNLKDVLIAVVDTGVDYTLADLKGKVVKEEGYDFINRDNDAYDDEGHGTHVSGIIAASSDNGYSIAGIHPKAKIMPVKVLDASGSGDTDKIALGIKYAVDHGAKVINLSLGGSYSRVIEEMLKYAASKNVTVIAASGNDSSDVIGYPASSRYTISVGATNRLDVVADYSNYGEGLDLVAPGTEIPSLLPDGNVTNLSGTSMAAPHVTAVAGLLLSLNDALTPLEVQGILTQTADDISTGDPSPLEEYLPALPGYDYESGWGRLNALSVISYLKLGIAVNPFTDEETKVTGNAVQGTTIEVKNGEETLGKGTADANGSFSITISPQEANQVLQLVAKKDTAQTTVKVVVLETEPPAPPTVNAVSDRDQTVKGQADPGTTLTVKTDTNVKGKTKIIGTGKAGANGQFSINISKQKAGTTLYVTATSPLSHKESEAAKLVVKDKTAPATLRVKTVSNRDKQVTGTTEANAIVTVKSKGKTLSIKKADAKGKFTITIKTQKAGTVLYVTAKDAAGNSKSVKLVVKDKTPPAAPKVNKLTNKSSFISGKAEKYSTVIVKHKGKTIGTKKADAKGKFKLKIKNQKAGAVLYVIAKDRAGNTSKAAKIKVQKAK
ncbi:S8 family peptidase [Bacillus rubiinfantis]|uniref:S8 family peptidase n=1 Tax=Bacillus rubiinfantis TaxID=1499680 RepID=UPI0005A751BD|nr:Ig-like domain-containing protein [Bacillus rubiinfantis]